MNDKIERLRLAAEDAAGGPPSAEQVDALIAYADALEAELAASQPGGIDRDAAIDAIAGGTISVPGGYGELARDDAENIVDAILGQAAVPDAATAAEAFRELGIKHKAERDAALAAIERVRALHKLGWQQEPYGNGPDGQVLEHAVSWCLHCDMASPCDTLAALDGAPEPEWEFRVRTDYGRVIASGTQEEVEVAASYYTPSPPVERRRKAGPWEPVGGETDG